jgi:hypothetical protein
LKIIQREYKAKALYEIIEDIEEAIEANKMHFDFKTMKTICKNQKKIFLAKAQNALFRKKIHDGDKG